LQQFYKTFNIYMHNTNDKMKRSELQEMIRTAIAEAINEADLSPAEKTAKDAEMKAIDAKIKALNSKKSDLSSGREEIVEDENIDEMANVAVRYELAPDAAAADFTGKKARIVTAMQATEEPMSKIDVASALGYDKQNPINADFMALVADGVIIPSGTQSAPRLNRPAGEPAAAAADDDDEFGFVRGDMSDEEVDATFAKAMAAGDDEPEIGDIERSSISAATMSDEDYEAFMKVSDLEQRLAATKSNILKLKKSKGVAGDIGDRPSDELQRLRDLKVSLEKRIADAVASSKYLQQRQEKATGKKYEPIDIEDVETEPLDEWTRGRMQYYAGIKK
jgi:regulator of replication initiation timing